MKWIQKLALPAFLASILATGEATASKLVCVELHICPDQLAVESDSQLSAFEEAYGAVKKYTKYRITENPSIQFVDKDDLMDIYIATLEDNTEWKDYFLYTLQQRRTIKQYRSTAYRRKKYKIKVESVYDAVTNTIFFPRSWDHKNIRDRGLLAHELTHVAQQQSFVSPECQAGLEEIALLVAYGFYLDNEYFKKAAAIYPQINEHVLQLEYKNQIGWISVCFDFEPAALNLF